MLDYRLFQRRIWLPTETEGCFLAKYKVHESNVASELRKEHNGQSSDTHFWHREGTLASCVLQDLHRIETVTKGKKQGQKK